MTLTVKWNSHRRKATCDADPEFPNGRVLDASQGAQSCQTALPYPAPECGYHLVYCTTCHQRTAITAAGRPDDPRSIRIPCRQS